MGLKARRVPTVHFGGADSIHLPPQPVPQGTNPLQPILLTTAVPMQHQQRSRQPLRPSQAPWTLSPSLASSPGNLGQPLPGDYPAPALPEALPCSDHWPQPGFLLALEALRAGMGVKRSSIINPTCP